MSQTAVIPEVTRASADTVGFVLNGHAVEAPADRNRSLLEVLRDEFGCISLKNKKRGIPFTLLPWTLF